MMADLYDNAIGVLKIFLIIYAVIFVIDIGFFAYLYKIHMIDDKKKEEVK
jgi:hypothetical protein